jgi:hypothetical protein
MHDRLLTPEAKLSRRFSRTLQKLHQSLTFDAPAVTIAHHCSINARAEPLKSSNMMSKASAGTQAAGVDRARRSGKGKKRERHAIE